MDSVPGNAWCSPLEPYAAAGATTVSPRRSARPAATATAIRVSVSSGRCGPCCSSEPTGTASRASRRCTSGQVSTPSRVSRPVSGPEVAALAEVVHQQVRRLLGLGVHCLLYTSDAADDLLC